MLIPVLMPLCAFTSSAPDAVTGGTGGTVTVALAALGLHTAVMLAAIAVISLAVYNWIGVAFLRRGWINLDFVWIAALMICGVILLFV